MRSSKLEEIKIKRLINEKKYFEIYEKYGEVKYEKYLKLFRKEDILYELGIEPKFINFLFLENCKEKMRLIKKGICYFTLATTITASMFDSIIEQKIEKIVKENEKKYSLELEQYEQDIKEYAEYVNSLGLTDLEVLIEVMGVEEDFEYKEPTTYDEIGLYRLSAYMNGYGVCRNFADDAAYRLNAINPSYKACVLATYLQSVEPNNISQNIIEANRPTVLISTEDEESSDLKKYVGNHLVVCLKIDDALLIMDPTNPSIGLLDKGKIEMFSDNAKDGMYPTPLNILYNHGAGNRKLLQSYITNSDYEMLKQKYSIKEQNKAIKTRAKKLIINNYQSTK